MKRSITDAVDIDPTQALLLLVRLKYGEVVFCTARIQDIEDAGEDLLLTTVEITERPLNLGKEGEDPTTMVTETRTSNKVDLAAWVRVLHEAERDLAKFSAMAITAGVAERIVRLEEQQAERVAMTVYNILSEIGADMKRALPTIEKHLRALDAPVIEGTVVDDDRLS